MIIIDIIHPQTLLSREEIISLDILHLLKNLTYLHTKEFMKETRGLQSLESGNLASFLKYMWELQMLDR